MNNSDHCVLLLADRLGVHDDGWSVGPFLDRLESQGFDAQVVCVEAAGGADDDPRVVEAPGLSGRWRMPMAVRSLRGNERLARPDLIHVLHSSMGESGLALAEHWGLPYVRTVDEFVPDGGRLRLSRRWCRRLVANSQELAHDLQTQLGVPADGVTVINPGIEAPEELAPKDPGRRVSVIGTAGPLIDSSGFTTFLNAARRVLDAGVDAEFVIAGQGEDEADLRRRADRLRIADRVTFAGIPVVGLRFWSVLDLFCQPSLVPSVGRTLATALGFGAPSVASDIEGLRAIVTHDRNGLLVPPGDSGALAAAMLSLLSDPRRAGELGLEGRTMIQREYRTDVEARLLTELYREVIAGPPATARVTLACR